MNRRDFLLLAGVIAMAWNPASAEVKIPRIGFIQTGSRQENHSLLDAFRAGLSALGWTEGNNIVVLDRWAEDRTDQLPAIVKELIGSDVTILVTAGTPATLAARRASTTIPIVLVGVEPRKGEFQRLRGRCLKHQCLDPLPLSIATNVL